MLRSPTLYLFYHTNAVVWYLLGVQGSGSHCTLCHSQYCGHCSCFDKLCLQARWPLAMVPSFVIVTCSGPRTIGMNCSGLVFRYSTSHNVREKLLPDCTTMASNWQHMYNICMCMCMYVCKHNTSE